MYYEERVINGVNMCRSHPKGEWRFLKGDLPTVVGNILLAMGRAK